MKNNFLTIVITTLALLWSAGAKAQSLTVVHATAGSFATEAQAALDASNQQASDITNLTITGVAFNQDDVKVLNNLTSNPTIFPNLKVLDVSGLASIGGTDNNGLCTLMTSLEEAVLPYLSQIPNSIFQGCSKLTSVKIKNQEGTITNLFDEDITGITVINKYAFADCGILEINELPLSITNMGASAFRNCYKLNIRDIPKYNNEKFQEDLFRECPLTDFTIPASITSIAKTALYSTNTNLQRTFTIRQVDFPKTTKPVFATNATVAANTTIKVLKSSLETYKIEWTGTNPNDVGLNFVALTQIIAVNITGGEYGAVGYSGDGLVSAVADNAASVEAYEGEDLTFTFSPVSGSQVSISVDGGEAFTPEENIYTLTNISQDGHTINVTFTEPPQTVWTGEGNDALWTDADNWSNGVPTTEVDIYIPSGTTNIPVIPDETTVKTITFDQGAQADLQGSLVVTEAVNVKYKVTDRWYSIGFPFEENKEVDVRSEWFERNGWSPLLPYKADSYADNYYGDYYLKEYNPNLNPPFSDTHETIISKKGYIIRFPDFFVDYEGNNGDIITFSSGPQTLSKGSNISVTGDYQLVVNLTLKNIELGAPDGNKYYYFLDPEENKYNLLENAQKDLLPFEALITISTNNPENLVHTIGADSNLTGIGRFGVDNDSVIATHHYTLQGIEIKQPMKSEIYIVKKRYSSGKESVGKIIYK